MKNSNTVQNLLSVVLVVCALIVTGLVLRRELVGSPAAVPDAEPRHVPDWRSFASGAHQMGPPDAVVTITEFSDFQCPFCRVMAARLDTLQREQPRLVRLVPRHFPLAHNPHARGAATAAECAGAQGRFMAIRRVIFEHQDSIGAISWTDFAGRAGVADTGEFASCMAGVAASSAVQLDRAAGDRLGVTGTPTILINGYRFKGAVPLDTLRGYVTRAAAEAAATAPRRTPAS
jgi:protein-disulfide isomerase